MGLPTWVGFLFGTVLVAVGTLIILRGTTTLAVNPGLTNAAFWVPAVAGASFAVSGFVAWGRAWGQLAANRQRLQAARQYPNEPALADYPWHPGGFEVSGWRGAGRVLGLAIGITIFLSIFNWWAFGKLGDWMIKAVVVCLDLLTLLFWWEAGRRIGRALKFGRSRIAFARFPYRPPEPVVIRWHPGERISQVNKGTFTLRCVEQWTESRAMGKDRTVKLVQEEVWSAAWRLDKPRKLPVKDAVELCYELPPDAPPTQLSAYKPVFWELEVQLDLPGLDFKETYLVPIYAAKDASPSSGPTLAPVTAAV
jgi:hypothetical protein